MAARSVEVHIENYLDTSLTITPESQVLDHGVWTTMPPLKIAKADGGVPGKGEWQSESDGLATGTEGHCIYAFYDAAAEEIFYIKIHWNDPFVGTNSYDIHTNSDAINVSYRGGAGDNSTVTFKIAKK